MKEPLESTVSRYFDHPPSICRWQLHRQTLHTPNPHPGQLSQSLQPNLGIIGVSTDQRPKHHRICRELLETGKVPGRDRLQDIPELETTRRCRLTPRETLSQNWSPGREECLREIYSRRLLRHIDRW